MRSFDRAADGLRPITLTPHVSRHAEGSCLVECGYTKVLCTASFEDRTPHWLRDTGKGWVTAEYGMLPRATNSRNGREAARGKQSGRTQEIQRLIGRSLRAVTNLAFLNEKQILIDCDVLEADGGTRTASITGAYVALHLACQKLMKDGRIVQMPLTQTLGAISCGICNGVPLLDLDYSEDSQADVDANFVMTGKGTLVEVQATAEEAPFATEAFTQLLTLAQKGIAEITEKQKQALGL